MKSSQSKQSIGIAFGSGSARGLAHIGVLKVLEAEGVQIDYISGTSMGALIGAAYSMGIPLSEMEDIASRVDLRRELKLFAPIPSKSSVISDKAIMEFLDSLFGDKTIEELAIPFRAVSVDIFSGERVVLSKGKLTNAVRASISIPMALSPVRHNGRILVDGGLSNPVPVDVVRDMGAEFVIAVPLINQYQISKETESDGSQTDNSKHFGAYHIPNWFSRFLTEGRSSDESLEQVNIHHQNMLSIFWQSIGITANELTRLNMEINPPDLVICPNTRAFKLWEFHKSAEIIEEGKKAALESLHSYYKQDKRDTSC